MNLSNPELETVLRCVDKVFDFSAERDRLRDLLATLEAENKGLAARVAELEAEAKQASEDEAWAHSEIVGCAEKGEDGWQAYRWSARMQWMDRVNAPTIHAAIRALRAKVEGGAR